MKHRESGTISGHMYGQEDHGILTCFVYVDYDNGSCQGFGGLCLGADYGLDYVKSLCDTFGVERLEDLAGMRCNILRNFTDYNASIEGLEDPDTGKRFTLTKWRRKHWSYEESSTPYHRERARLESDIQQAYRTIEDRQEKLKTLDARYVDWDAVP